MYSIAFTFVISSYNKSCYCTKSKHTSYKACVNKTKHGSSIWGRYTKPYDTYVHEECMVPEGHQYKHRIYQMGEWHMHGNGHQNSPQCSNHTPVSDNGGSRPRNDWTPRSQILQPITNSSHPQNDLISLIQHQGMLQKVLTLPKKDVEEQQKVPMEKQDIIYLRKGWIHWRSLLFHLGVVTRRPGSRDNSLWVVIILHVSLPVIICLYTFFHRIW